VTSTDSSSFSKDSPSGGEQPRRGAPPSVVALAYLSTYCVNVGGGCPRQDYLRGSLGTPPVGLGVPPMEPRR
jgi:hypothetical protein